MGRLSRFLPQGLRRAGEVVLLGPEGMVAKGRGPDQGPRPDDSVVSSVRDSVELPLRCLFESRTISWAGRAHRGGLVVCSRALRGRVRFVWP